MLRQAPEKVSIWMFVTSGTFFMKLLKLKLPKSVKGLNNILPESCGAFLFCCVVFFVFAKLTTVGYFCKKM